MSTYTIVIYFKPQPDITAYELASIIANMVGDLRAKVGCSQRAWDEMDPAIKRHWAIDGEYDDAALSGS